MWDLFCRGPAWELTQASLADNPAWCCTLQAGLAAANGNLDDTMQAVGQAHGMPAHLVAADLCVDDGDAAEEVCACACLHLAGRRRLALGSARSPSQGSTNHPNPLLSSPADHLLHVLERCVGAALHHPVHVSTRSPVARAGGRQAVVVAQPTTVTPMSQPMPEL